MKVVVFASAVAFAALASPASAQWAVSPPASEKEIGRLKKETVGLILHTDKIGKDAEKLKAETAEIKADAKKTAKKADRLEDELIEIDGAVVSMGHDISVLQGYSSAQWGIANSLALSQSAAITAANDQQKQVTANTEAVNAHGNTLGEHEKRIEEGEKKDRQQDNALKSATKAITKAAKETAGKVEAASKQTAAELAQIREAAAAQEEKLSKEERKNNKQDKQISKLQDSDAKQNKRIRGVEQHNARQDDQLAGHEKRITVTEAETRAHAIMLDHHGRTLASHGEDIRDLGRENADQWRAISSHEKTLDAYGVQIGQLREGVAMAMAMPDTWLSDLESFAVAGNVATYDGATALGFAFVGRLTTHSTMNIKAAGTSDLKQFGLSAGYRYGW